MSSAREQERSAGTAGVGALGAGEFRFRFPVEVRFRDLDAMGHVHHSVVPVYFEEARTAYWRDVAGQGGTDVVGYVIGQVTVRYHARIHYPQDLQVLTRVSHLGGSSWSMEYQLHGSDGRLLASGESTQVMYDYRADRSIPIPDAIRERIERYQSPAG